MRDLIITEFRLFVYPVVVGRGRRLFPDGGAQAGKGPKKDSK